MPQLDKLIFLPQIIWYLIIFIAIYIYVLKYILPIVSRTIKIREKYINELTIKSKEIEKVNTVNYKHQIILKNELEKQLVEEKIILSEELNDIKMILVEEYIKVQLKKKSMIKNNYNYFISISTKRGYFLK